MLICMFILQKKNHKNVCPQIDRQTALAVSSHFLHCMFVARSPDTKTMSLNFNFKLSLFKLSLFQTPQSFSTTAQQTTGRTFISGFNAWLKCYVLAGAGPTSPRKSEWEADCSSHVTMNLWKMLDACVFEDYMWFIHYLTSRCLL